MIAGDPLGWNKCFVSGSIVWSLFQKSSNLHHYRVYEAWEPASLFEASQVVFVIRCWSYAGYRPSSLSRNGLPRKTQLHPQGLGGKKLSRGVRKCCQGIKLWVEGWLLSVISFNSRNRDTRLKLLDLAEYFGWFLDWLIDLLVFYISNDFEVVVLFSKPSSQFDTLWSLIQDIFE